VKRALALLPTVVLLAACNTVRQVEIRTEPSDAAIRVDGEEIGKSPVTYGFDFADPDAMYTVTAEKEGYVTRKKRISQLRLDVAADSREAEGEPEGPEYVVLEIDEDEAWTKTTPSEAANAWVEIEVLPGYWRRYDPTPSDDFAAIHQPTPTLWSEARKLAQAIEFAWVSAIVAFDGERQREIAAFLGLGNGSGAQARPQQRPERVWTRRDAYRFVSASLVVAGSVLALAGLAGLIARLGPVRRLLGRVRGKSLGAGVGFYRGLLHAADKLGRPRAPGESAMAHAEAAAAFAGRGGAEARALVGLYYRSVFDPRGLTAELERAVRRAWRRHPPIED